MKTFLFCCLAAVLFTGSICIAGQEITLKLGKQGTDFGASQQAAALLKLIEANPGSAQYRITYYTDSDVIVFGCNLEKDILLRFHSDLAGHGTSEEWHGHILYRIKDAVAGGSLDNTPEGKLIGSVERF